MNDEQLIREYCLRDSQEAFAELVRRYAGLVYGTACRHARDAFAAEEICQEVFCALARQIGALRKESIWPSKDP
jgi:DNA-directed RNA polymerase specialized sigma24 family protein